MVQFSTFTRSLIHRKPIMMTQTDHTVYLHTGSNLGNRLQNLHRANAAIEARIGTIVRFSPVYVTAAWGIQEQPNFFNQALEVTTTLDPEAVLDAALQIEADMGRQRGMKWSERLIDIDVLFYDQLVLQTEKLTLPHPWLHERRFVLAPLMDIAPDWIHPVFGVSIRRIFLDLKDFSFVEILTE
jgi:2-amino-4-hydroxy-6-hydroxymethyldihydropteridine diphosphokinase